MIFDALPLAWKVYLGDVVKADYIRTLDAFLSDAYENETVYPLKENLFNAFTLTPPSEVKVVILGQDPYHDEGQSHGLAFSVPHGISFPPSLRNIFKELHEDVGCVIPSDGDLSAWGRSGVLLLNTVLSVRAHEAHSHKGKGWEVFTDGVIKSLSDRCENLVFILWGKPAQTKMKLIDTTKHHVITSAHPSPLSSYRGFFGSKPFSRTNDYLMASHKTPIEWCTF